MTVPLREAGDPALYGGKAAGLAKSLAAGLPVPNGIALAPDEAARVAAGAVVDVAHLGPLLAVRSSATAEDGAAASFAGQFTTKLGVPPSGVAEAVREVVASASKVAGYQARVGSSAALRMAVVIQELITPSAAGVLFTKNPVSGADERVIEACYGLGEAVVSGLVTPDTYRVARGGKALEVHAGYKDIALYPEAGGGVRQVEIEEHRAWFRALDDAALRALDELATRCETLFGGPRDIEWALVDDASGRRLVLLQCRPVTGGVMRRPQGASP